VTTSPLTEEVAAVSGATDDAPVLLASAVRAAWKGQEARATELIAAMIEDARAEHQPMVRSVADYARAVLYNGLGRYRDGLAAAERACAHKASGSITCAALELVEAAARTNRRGVASEALSWLEESACATGTNWTLGIRARSAALLSDGDQAEALYHEAIELLSRTPAIVHLARARLVYGEWLRRENRRVDAREQLRAAHQALKDIAAGGFADRAHRELLATGETARRRMDETRADLTPQEVQIARLAREGFTNPEIGARLFISPRTAQYHLRKVFRKLEITSRNQLGRVPDDRLGLRVCN
jgi:DNA-binding CsgD family transcriptional regulator